MKMYDSKQYKSREGTDTFFAEGNFAYNGIVDEMIRLAEDKQLVNRALWQLVAGQFADDADDEDGGWRGEYWGKLMRGACMVYKYTNSEELYDTLTYAVKALLENQDELGRICTYSVEKEFNGWDMWSRKYVLLGLLHFYEICNDEAFKAEILEAAEVHLDYIISKIGQGEGKTEITHTSESWQGINSSSILEPVMRMYNVTDKKEYLDFAAYIIGTGAAAECNIFELALKNEIPPYQYPVVKAYEMMSCFEGLLEYYRVTKEEKWKIAVENFAKSVIDTEITIIGSAGCRHECFNNSVLMQTYTKYNGLMLETCVTVTWMKLCFQLLRLTGQSIYAEQIENAAYNALYGSVNTEGRSCTEKTTFDREDFRPVYQAYTAKYGVQLFDSYSPIRAGIRGRAVGGFRPMNNGQDYCGCCIAIGAAGLALVPQASMSLMKDGISVNMYIDGTADMCVDGTDVQLCVSTKYPVCGNVEIEVNPQYDKEFEIRLRIPSFSVNTAVKVNGVTMSEVEAGEYFAIKRVWKSGDKIELALDMNPRLAQGMPNSEDAESEKHIAVLYGPLVLARDARIGDVGEAVRVTDKNLIVKPKENGMVKAMCAFDVNIDGTEFTMIDYASSGKTWDDESITEVWMKMI